MKTQKKKGSKFERDLAKYMSSAGEWKRVPGSGALGTITNTPSLFGDVYGKLHPDLPEFTFIVEAKHGYGGSTQITMKREWVDKAVEYTKKFASSGTGMVPYPLVVIKPNYARMDDSIVVIRLADFRDMLINIIRIYEDMLVSCDEYKD